ncbi:LysE/ArgO family amino acid transporter [Paracoccus sp. P2]|uniref:Amino acid transporter n=1 Tax=Paracoccus pantotrophus TaxID=82367 RepID=A0A1I5CEC8_PARPN|nr:LysE/ArgO family amino acid transporter [Paracoccus pantotrophus]MDF3852965.1 LysE/ArgO family amino acid transporter [Paracoccus pantotrophus]QFG35674.1 amino acid transporter [Paracoccus pantotrophus]QLH13947.1 amino acid transporter [Paracoccus pantotrophus]RDE01066.1 amino acid transporter [Paracoccus pantotrophus]RKS44082.1 L-lysine exporter family protein LysE/ArgO [Paracoccus pantotrophus]
MQAYFAGLGTALSLIVAIGAQNAFVLRQGLMRRHVLATCAFCAISDAVLITAGVLGAGAIAAQAPWFLAAMRWGGAAFLLAYGARAFRAAWRGGEALRAGPGHAAGLGATLLVLAGLTWLNPHVWLDTVVLIGSVSAAWENKPGFVAGAVSGSVLFFFALGYGARWLSPLFARPAAWRVLDGLVGLVMWSIALGLLLGG